jgi:DNA-binding FadR family transcriptional regulator
MTRSGKTSRSGAGRNLTHRMVDDLGRAIVVGDYEGKVFPTEAELAKQQGVSRSVTREAVKMLAAKGLLKGRPRQGTVIQPQSSWNLFDGDILRWTLERRFSLDLLIQFNQLRIALEPEAAALAAANSSHEERAAIASGLARMEAAEKGQGDPLEADIAFHVAILAATGNPFYRQLSDMVETALRTSILFTNQMGERASTLPLHEAVGEAIQARDPSSARWAMQMLIADVFKKIEGAKLSGAE